MKVLGLSGYGRSGKTTAADYIERTYGIRRVHIATTLRKMLAELLRDLGLSEQEIYEHLEGKLKEDVIPAVGVSGRSMQISIGTAWGREKVHPDLWVRTWAETVRRAASKGVTIGLRDPNTGRFSSAPARGSMNDSVRFPNEEDAITEMGGFTILIERPGTHPVAFKWNILGFEIGRALYERFGWMIGVHDSERTDRLDPTYIISNDSTLEDLYTALDAIMRDQGIEKLARAA